MSTICAILAISLLVLFSAVNLFLPYALIVAAVFVGVFYACGAAAGRSGKQACPLGMCR